MEDAEQSLADSSQVGGVHVVGSEEDIDDATESGVDTPKFLDIPDEPDTTIREAGDGLGVEQAVVGQGGDSTVGQLAVQDGISFGGSEEERAESSRQVMRGTGDELSLADVGGESGWERLHDIFVACMTAVGDIDVHNVDFLRLVTGIGKGIPEGRKLINRGNHANSKEEVEVLFEFSCNSAGCYLLLGLLLLLGKELLAKLLDVAGEVLDALDYAVIRAKEIREDLVEQSSFPGGKTGVLVDNVNVGGNRGALVLMMGHGHTGPNFQAASASDVGIVNDGLASQLVELEWRKRAPGEDISPHLLRDRMDTSDPELGAICGQGLEVGGCVVGTKSGGNGSFG